MTNEENLPHIFDTLYDLKTKTQLHNEVEYLVHRIAGIIGLCEEHSEGMDVRSYLNMVISNDVDTSGENTNQLLKKLFYYLDMTEESDSGKVFHPTIITSCRVMDGEAINEVLKQLKAQITTE